MSLRHDGFKMTAMKAADCKISLAKLRFVVSNDFMHYFTRECCSLCIISIYLYIYFFLKGRGSGPCVKVTRELTSRQGKRQGKVLLGRRENVKTATDCQRNNKENKGINKMKQTLIET